MKMMSRKLAPSNSSDKVLGPDTQEVAVRLDRTGSLDWQPWDPNFGSTSPTIMVY